MLYENLLIEYSNSDLIIKEKDLPLNKGRIKGNKIAIRRSLSAKEKGCILAEELGHYFTTVGNILDQSNINNRKQELQARLWAYNKLIGLHGIVSAYLHGCCDFHEMAEYLDVTEEFLYEALFAYREKYGDYVKYKGYIINFAPTLHIELIKQKEKSI